MSAPHWTRPAVPAGWLGSHGPCMSLVCLRCPGCANWLGNIRRSACGGSAGLFGFLLFTLGDVLGQGCSGEAGGTHCYNRRHWCCCTSPLGTSPPKDSVVASVMMEGCRLGVTLGNVLVTNLLVCPSTGFVPLFPLLRAVLAVGMLRLSCTGCSGMAVVTTAGVTSGSVCRQFPDSLKTGPSVWLLRR